MQEKTGRERQLILRDPSFGNPGDQWMFGMLLEVGDRVLDQIDHLPPAALNTAPAGSYLFPARVVLHLVGTDLRLFPSILGTFESPDYAEDVRKTTSEDFSTMAVDHLDAVDILRRHVAWRRPLVKERGTVPGLLEQPVDHPAAATRRDLLGHLIWHWSFHSGHIGAVTLELGYEYVWTSAKKG